jgi:hypothetical protein
LFLFKYMFPTPVNGFTKTSRMVNTKCHRKSCSASAKVDRIMPGLWNSAASAYSKVLLRVRSSSWLCRSTCILALAIAAQRGRNQGFPCFVAVRSHMYQNTPASTQSSKQRSRPLPDSQITTNLGGHRSSSIAAAPTSMWRSLNLVGIGEHRTHVHQTARATTMGGGWFRRPIVHALSQLT